MNNFRYTESVEYVWRYRVLFCIYVSRAGDVNYVYMIYYMNLLQYLIHIFIFHIRFFYYYYFLTSYYLVYYLLYLSQIGNFSFHIFSFIHIFLFLAFPPPILLFFKAFRFPYEWSECVYAMLWYQLMGCWDAETEMGNI